MRWKRTDKKELQKRRLAQKDTELKKELAKQFDWFDKYVLGENNQQLQ